jgi:hypothetical protein
MKQRNLSTWAKTSIYILLGSKSMQGRKGTDLNHQSVVVWSRAGLRYPVA